MLTLPTTTAPIKSILPIPSSATVSELSASDFDPRGQYSEVLEAVKEASHGGSVKVFRVELDGTRLEYWVLAGTKSEEKLVVGFKAKAVES